MGRELERAAGVGEHGPAEVKRPDCGRGVRGGTGKNVRVVFQPFHTNTCAMSSEGV